MNTNPISKILDVLKSWRPILSTSNVFRTFYRKIKLSEHILWKITDFDKKSPTLRGWEKILRKFFDFFWTRVPSINFPKNLISRDSIERARRNLQLKSPGKTCTPPVQPTRKIGYDLREPTHVQLTRIFINPKVN